MAIGLPETLVWLSPAGGSSGRKEGPDKAEDGGGTRSCRAMNGAQKLGLLSGG